VWQDGVAKSLGRVARTGHDGITEVSKLVILGVHVLLQIREVKLLISNRFRAASGDQ